jgi:O-antigen chain-terminating methyltransferase
VARVLQEATRAERAEERANLAEGRAQQELARAERAEERVNLSEARVLQEATRAERAEERANLAEGRLQQTNAERWAQVAEAKAQQTEAECRAQQAEAKTKLVEVQLEATRKELHDAHQANHHHWQQWEATKLELHSVHRSNHQHWQLAQARQETIQAIYSSRSWRVTAPLRWVARPRMGRSGTGAVPPAPTFTDRLIRWGMARPRLVAVTHTMVDGMPPLRSAISRRVANVLAVVGRVPATALEHNSLAEYARVDPIDGQPKPVVQDADLHNLSPHARHIYAGLKAAIEQNDREHA